MLKSTHVPLPTQQPPLAAPWTEHKAPTGHTYYYNPDTKKSTYTRPIAPPSPAPEPSAPEPSAPAQPEPLRYDPTSVTGWSVQPSPAFAAQFGGPPTSGGVGAAPHRHRKFRPDDRPKTKHPIPGHAPWLLIKTRLRRRFVYNPETGESLWKPPQDLVKGLVEFDIQERKKKERKERGEEEPNLSHVLGGADLEPQKTNGQADRGADGDEASGSEEYEEVEVTDSEYASEGHSPKRRKTSPPLDRPHDGEEEEEPEYMIEAEDEEENPPPEPTGELGEDDMAAQLAAMGHDYDLDPTEYYHEEGDEGEAYDLTQEEVEASFKDMLDDHQINPYSTWENIISSDTSQIISDDRYTLLPNMHSRRKIFGQWSSERIAQLKVVREKQVKQNPRIPYLRLLKSHATPKLYWPEFKRKWKKEPEMKDSKLSDKDREKLYRDYITRITKFTESQRRDDLLDLLKTIAPGPSWNRSSSIDGTLPDALLTDIRFATLPPKVRDPLVSDAISNLPTAGEVADMGTLTEEEKRERQERQKRDEAMRRRGEQVEAKKRDQQKELHFGQRRLRAEEMELERAQKVSAGGLREHLQT